MNSPWRVVLLFILLAIVTVVFAAVIGWHKHCPGDNAVKFVWVECRAQP